MLENAAESHTSVARFVSPFNQVESYIEKSLDLFLERKVKNRVSEILFITH